MRSIKNIIMIFGAIFIMSCEKEVQLDVNQTEEKLVIESKVTDSMLSHPVILRTSNDLYETGDFPGIDNAEVRIVETSPDGTVSTIQYHHNSERKGFYLPESPFAGKIGYEYHLQINWKGKYYEAKDILLPVTAIDSLVIEPVDEDFEPSDALIDSLGTATGPFYWVKFYAYEPPERVDFYTWKFYRNGVFKNDEGRWVYYASDEIVQENIDGIYVPGTYTTGDTVRVEMYSLSRIGYLYYFDLETVINSDGGMFSPPPANPRTNVSNGALGFFQVSAIEEIELVIG